MAEPADLYETFFQAANEAIFLVDTATGKIVAANARALSVTGFSAEEITAVSLDRLFRPQNALGLSFFLEHCANAPRPGCHGLQLIRKNEETIQVSVNPTWLEWKGVQFLFLVARETDAAALGACQGRDEGAIPWSEEEDFPTIIGQSETIRDVCRLIGDVAKSDVTVLIQGESGTGKEVIANAIHMHSHRRRGPFVKVNCAAITETLLESELFGHVKGAFTGAIRDRCGRFKQADRGTILLDEIGSMSLAGQAKLLRVLQEHEFEPVGSSVTTSIDVRVLASTNVDLEKAAGAGRFREDLYYRLNVFCIRLPPLRDRKDDVPMLAQHLLTRYSRIIGKPISGISPETFALLIDYDWPGNVRELENAIEHAVIVEKGPVVFPSSLPMNLTRLRPVERDAAAATSAMGLRERLTLLERQILLETLSRAKGVKKHAADMLGIDARNLPYLLRKHHLSSDLKPH